MTRLINIVFYSAIAATALCGVALAYLLVIGAPSEKVEARAPAPATQQADKESGPREIITGAVPAPANASAPDASTPTRETARRDADGERIPVWLAPTTRYKASELAMPAAPSTATDRSLDGRSEDNVERISERPHRIEVETPAAPPPPVVTARQRPAYDSPFYRDTIQ